MWKHTSTHPFLIDIGYCSNGNGQVALEAWRRVNYALCSLVQLKKRETGCVLVHYDDPPLPDPIQDLVREMFTLPKQSSETAKQVHAWSCLDLKSCCPLGLCGITQELSLRHVQQAVKISHSHFCVFTSPSPSSVETSYESWICPCFFLWLPLES